MNGKGPSLPFYVFGGAKIFAVLHLIAIPIILIWWYEEAQDAYRALILQRPHEGPSGVTFLMQLYIAISGALFWAAVAAALGLAEAKDGEVAKPATKDVNSAEKG